MIEIDGASIGLRKFEPEDVNALYSFRNDRDVASSLGGFSTGYAKTDLAGWIEYHASRNDEVVYAVVDDTDQVIGHVGLYQIDHRVRKAEFAVLIGNPAFQGRGLGRTISQWMVEYGFLELNLNKVTLSVLANNRRARQYLSVGFVEEGVMRRNSTGMGNISTWS